MAKKFKTTEAKLNYLIAKVESIDRAVHPPFYKSLISWVFSNLWTFIFLALIGYVLWQVWEVVQSLQMAVSDVETKINGVKTSITDQFSTVSETLKPFKNINLEKWKFWE